MFTVPEKIARLVERFTRVHKSVHPEGRPVAGLWIDWVRQVVWMLKGREDYWEDQIKQAYDLGDTKHYSEATGALEECRQLRKFLVDMFPQTIGRIE